MKILFKIAQILWEFVSPRVFESGGKPPVKSSSIYAKYSICANKSLKSAAGAVLMKHPVLA